MHEQDKSGDAHDRPSAAIGGEVRGTRVSAASVEVVRALAASAGSGPVGAPPNPARRAALNAVAVARCAVRGVPVSAAHWPPLLVPVTAARPVRQARTCDVFAFRPGDRVLSGRPAPAPAPAPSTGAAVRAPEGGAVPAPNAASAGGGPAGFGAVLSSVGVGSSGVAAFPGVSAVATAGESATGLEARAPATDRARQRGLGFYVRRAFRWGALVFAVWFAAMLALIVLFRFVDPPGSTLIAWQAVTGTKIERRWVPLSKISANLQRAVIVSEDGRFCQHWGIDPREVLAAIQRARGGVPRGASTITMQVAKNLFLWPSKSYLRKALEVPLTLAIELIWPKSRILEVYLNIVEWGPGVFGAEAAARHHFGRSAARLSRQQAALLAVSLPNPLVRVAGKPGRGVTRLSHTIMARMRVARSAASCVLPSR